ISLQVRAAALNRVALAFERLLLVMLFDVVTLGILHAFQRQQLEERVEELVVGALPLGLESAGKEDVVNPVFFVVDDAVLNQRAVDVEDVAIGRNAVPFANLAIDEVDHDLAAIAEIE